MFRSVLARLLVLVILHTFLFRNVSLAESLDDCFPCFDSSVPFPGSRVVGSFPVLDPPYSCQSQVIDLTRNYADDGILATPGQIVWVGGIYSASTVPNARPGEIVVDRRPLTASISLPNLPISSMVITNPSRSALFSALNTMLGSAGTNTVNPLAISFQYTSFSSREQTMLDLGIIADGSFWSGSAGFGRIRTKDEQTVFLTVFQPYYVVSIDQPFSPSDLFTTNVTCQDIRRQLRAPIDAPVIAMSCVYGRAIVYELTRSITTSGTTTDAQVSAVFQKLMTGGSLSAPEQAVIAQLTIRALVLGGAPGSASGLMTTDGARRVYEEGLLWSNRSPGFPLLFSYHCLTWGFPQFAFSKSTTYVARNCNQDRGDGAFQVYSFGWDNGHNNTYHLWPDGRPHNPYGLPGTPNSPWREPRILGGSGGTLQFSYPQDYNVYAETYLYVKEAGSIPFQWSADTGFL